MPISARGRSTKQGSRPPFRSHQVEPTVREKCEGHTRHKSPKCHCKCAGHQQVAGGSLARVLSSTNGSCDIYWHPWVGADIEHLHGSVYHHDQELGIDWVPALKETSLVCHSAPIQEGL